ncbi:restriction endonuclease subunit S [Mesorhizobium cantuariense]|uniref:Type I restriction modification DNA specificity domain-containing protein n=1 Tax=Mesorhizobium cantuariense TaxID=1300275 RepID=A0ABV7MRS8_9HYPH
MNELPKGWAQVTFEDVVEINPRKSVDLEPDDNVTFVPMAAVNEISGTIVNGVSRPLREVNKGFTQFAEDDVIFAKITPSMENGKSAVATDLENGIGFGSTEFHVFRSYGAVLPKCLTRKEVG